MMWLIPRKEFYALVAAVEDSCNIQGNPGLVEEFLGNLEQARIEIESVGALPLLPSAAFGDAFGRGDTFLVSASEATSQISEAERG